MSTELILTILGTLITGLTAAVSYLFKSLHIDLKGAMAKCEKDRAEEKKECKETTTRLADRIDHLYAKLLSEYTPTIPAIPKSKD